jgi:hypothetical protein
MALLKTDRPRAVVRDREGIMVGRHYEDGSTRTTIYQPDGTAKIITLRMNASTGAEEKFVENPDGSTRFEVTTPSGDFVIVETAIDGSTERTETATDQNGNPTRTTTFADGTSEREVQLTDLDGSKRTVLTKADGTTEVTSLHTGKTESGETFFTEVKLDGVGGLVQRKETIVHADGSTTTTVRDGVGASHVVETVTTTVMPDGAVREHVQRADGTDETTLIREYTTADGARVQEVHSDDRVHITTDRDGMISETTKFEDGTIEANDVVRMPNGSIVITRTNRDKTFESTEQLPGDPVRTVTTRTDGTRIEQLLDNERMTTTVLHPDGTRTVTRLDPDGFGSTAEFDKDGNMTFDTVHNGEPLESRAGLLGDIDTPDVAIGEPAAAAVDRADLESADLVSADLVSAGADLTADPATMDPATVAPTSGDDSPMEPTEVAVATSGVAPAAAEPDDNAPIIEIDDDGNIEVDDFAETVNFAYTVTETPGGDIGPDPDVPAETPTESPLEPWDDDDVIEVDDYAETVNYAYTVTETSGGDIGPDPDVPAETPTDTPLEPWDDDDVIEVDDYAEPVNYAYTVTETSDGDIGPDPDVPTETPTDTPLEPW